MKYFSVTIFIALCALITSPLLSVSEFSRTVKPSEEERAIIESIKKEIYEEKMIIQKYYIDLKEKNRIEENQESQVPMKAEKHIFYGEKKRYLYNELGVIRWNGDQIASVRFQQRRGEMRSGNILKKYISFDFPASPSSMNINLIVVEHLTSGQGDRINFRFPPEGAEDIRDRMEEVTVNGISMPMMVVYIRNVKTRIDMLRESLDLMKLMRRRVDWMVRSDATRKSNRVQQLLDATHF